jgi:hypothetical protein
MVDQPPVLHHVDSIHAWRAGAISLTVTLLVMLVAALLSRMLGVNDRRRRDAGGAG